MRRSFLSLCLAFLCQHLFAQWSTSGTNISNTNTGNVGIANGSSFNAQYKLHIYDATGNGMNGIGMSPGSAVSDNTSIITVKTSNGTNGFLIKTMNTDSYHGQSAMFINYGNGAGLGAISLMSNALDFRTGTNYTDNITGSGFGTSALYINNAQQVGIGTTNPGTSKLAVAGTIAARKVIVTLASPWPDYVFDSGHRLPSLQHLETYIRSNGHLPGMPTADSVRKNGLDLGATQARLLEKIEELTLYTIELQKRIEKLETKKKGKTQQLTRR